MEETSYLHESVAVIAGNVVNYVCQSSILSHPIVFLIQTATLVAIIVQKHFHHKKTVHHTLLRISRTNLVRPAKSC